MHRTLFCLAGLIGSVCLVTFTASSQQLEPITLNPPDTARGLPFMTAVAVRASPTEWSDRPLSMQDLSDLLWAANGISRPEENKTTASSAMNAHDVDIYVFMENGVFVYDYRRHVLTPVVVGDHRSAAMMRRPGGQAGDTPTRPEAAIQVVLVSDASRFRAGTPEQHYEWGAIDTGIISQNIALFCAATGLKTRPRALIDKQGIHDLLGLGESQRVILNHPVGYAHQ